MRKRVGGADAAWFRMDQPSNRMTVTAVFRLEGPVDWERIEEAIIDRIVVKYPPFRRRIVRTDPPFSTLHWEPDPAFDPRRHVRRVRLPGAACDDLTPLVAELLSAPLDLSRPPWELLLVEDEQGGRAVLARLHHVLADGVALARVLLELTSEAGAPPAGTAPAGTAPAGRRSPRRGLRLPAPRQVARVAADAVRGTAAVARLLLLPADPATTLKGPLVEAKQAAWSPAIPLGSLKSAAAARGVTLNDVLLSAVAGALRRELVVRGETPAQLRAIVPVNLRPLDQPVPAELGNRFGLVFVALPVDVADPEVRVAEMAGRMDVRKGSVEAVATYVVLQALGLLPHVVEQALVRYLGGKATAVMTNVRGPEGPLEIAGSRIRELMFWVPRSGGLGLGVSILSVSGEVRVGVAADAGLVPDPRRLVDATLAELELLGVLATAPA